MARRREQAVEELPRGGVIVDDRHAERGRTSVFDTRQRPRNSRFYDVYATYSPNGGDSFTPNARVTPRSVDAGDATFIGDYMGVAAAGGSAHPVWTSGGFNGGRLETTVLRVP